MENTHSKSGYFEKNNKGTFIVRVTSTRNGTWQGTVVWADENRTRHFRSTLELLLMMHEALSGGREAGGIYDFTRMDNTG